MKLDLTQVAEMPRTDTAKLVFSVVQYRGKPYIDIREFVETTGFSGFTRRGIRFPADDLALFTRNLELVAQKADEMETT